MTMSRVMGLNKFCPSWRFLSAFSEFPKKKSSPKTGVSQITKYLNINSILTSQNYIQKIIASMICFCKKFISSQTSKLWSNKNLLCKWRHCPTVTTLPNLTASSNECKSLFSTRAFYCSERIFIVTNPSLCYRIWHHPSFIIKAIVVISQHLDLTLLYADWTCREINSLNHSHL